MPFVFRQLFTLKSYKVFFFVVFQNLKSYADYVICKSFFFSFSLFLLLASMISPFLENVDFPCIIKSQIISVSKAALVVSLKGRERMNVWKCAISWKFSPADLNL